MDQDCTIWRQRSTSPTSASILSSVVLSSNDHKVPPSIPLSEIQSLASKSTEVMDPSSLVTTKSVQKRKSASTRQSDGRKKSKQDDEKDNTNTTGKRLPSSHIVTEALKWATDNGLCGGYIEFLRGSSDESIKRSFQKIRSEFENRRSFSSTSTAVMRYLQAARILFNRLPNDEKRALEYIARDRVRDDFAKEKLLNGGLEDIPLFSETNALHDETMKEYAFRHACPMPVSEFIFADQKTLDNTKRYYTMINDRQIICERCPLEGYTLKNAAQYQVHMISHHPTAYLYACHHCGITFPSIDALKLHSDCDEFKEELRQRLLATADVELNMEQALFLTVCADCGTQQPVRSSYIGQSATLHWNDVLEFHKKHNAERLVPVIVYSETELRPSVRLRVKVLSPPVKGVYLSCPQCNWDSFTNSEELEQHIVTHEDFDHKICPECQKKFGQDVFYREHLLSHLDNKGCYLADYVTNTCTFLLDGVPYQGALANPVQCETVYGGVSSAIVPSRLSTKVDITESTTIRKRVNRRGRKRKGGSTYEKELDELHPDNFREDQGSYNLRKILGSTFDHEGVLKLNGYFYTANNLDLESEEESLMCNVTTGERCPFKTALVVPPGNALASSLATQFLRSCRLWGGKPLSKKHNPVQHGLYSTVYVCRRCHCICVGKKIYKHLVQCCPELQDQSSKYQFRLDDSLLVFCAFPGNALPNSRISCPECTSTSCSIFGLRIHMIVTHGIWAGLCEDLMEQHPIEPEFLSSTFRSINRSVGLTDDGDLPVDLRDKIKQREREKRKEATGLTTLTSSAQSEQSMSTIAISSTTPILISNRERRRHNIIHPDVNQVVEVPSESVQMSDCTKSPSVIILEPVSQSTESHECRSKLPRENHDGMWTESDSSMCVVEKGLIVQSIDSISELSDNTEPNFQEKHSVEAIVENCPIDCDFCGLTLTNSVALDAHLKYHPETVNICYLCDPYLEGFNSATQYLEHVRSKHFYPGEIKNGISYMTCRFCELSFPSSNIIAHLITNCYMAPCPICGAKLTKRSERTGHPRAHRNIFERFLCECKRSFPTYQMFTDHTCRERTINVIRCIPCNCMFPSLNGNARGIKIAFKHFMDEHVKSGTCIPCMSEPLITMKEHFNTHITDGSEVIYSSPVLTGCCSKELLKDTLQAELLYESYEDVQNLSGAAVHTVEQTSKESSVVPILPESETMSPSLIDHSGGEDRASTSEHLVPSKPAFVAEAIPHSATSEHLNDEVVEETPDISPSDNQLLVLESLVHSIPLPPSVVEIENVPAVVREERRYTPEGHIAPKSAIEDDGEDDILIIDEIAQQQIINQKDSQRELLAAKVTPLIHQVHEGDDDCMMMNIIELPTGVVSSTVPSGREKKYKCSMCSMTFYRESGRKDHESQQHRSDIGSDFCDDIYGVPLNQTRLVWICRQCAVAFEDEKRHKEHVAKHITKCPAYPCDMCSSICLTFANVKEHHQKHDEQRLSYRCLICCPQRLFCEESQILFHLYIHHGVPMLAFCKLCLVASSDLNRMYLHAARRECNTRLPQKAMCALIGFAIASELYYQPSDEIRHKQMLEASPKQYATPTLCSHRSFITFGDAFTTCSEDPTRCFGLVNQNRWHSLLCSKNRENPGEMPKDIPAAITTRNPVECMFAMLKQHSDQMGTIGRPVQGVAPITSVVAQFPQILTRDNRLPPITSQQQQEFMPQRIQQSFSHCQQAIEYPQMMREQQHVMPHMLNIQSTLQTPTQVSSQLTSCLFCGRSLSQVDVVFEPISRAHEIITTLCVKFREVHPFAASTHYTNLKEKVDEMMQNGLRMVPLCRSHYRATCFDSFGRLIVGAWPTVIDKSVLLGTSAPSQLKHPCSASFLQRLPALPLQAQLQPMDHCVVCMTIKRTVLCPMIYLLSVPKQVLLREQWIKSICKGIPPDISRNISIERSMRNTRTPMLCLRHFNPRAIQIEKGALSQAIPGEPPIFEFDRLTSLSNNFRQSFAKLLSGIEKGVNVATLETMLKIVQNEVRCVDEDCTRFMNSTTDANLHRFHQKEHKYICMECYDVNEPLITEQDTIKHWLMTHHPRNPGEMQVDLVYTMHCPMRNCRAVFQSIQRLRKHINHDHSNICNIPSDNCATRLCKTSQAILHNAQHEVHSRDVPCCYLCGLANPWQQEHEGLSISHDMIHAMHRFILCKGCMSPMGNDLKGELLLAHFKKCHMLDQPRRFHRCKICRHNVADNAIRDHIMGVHRIVAFRPRYAVESNMLLVTNGGELCTYLGIEEYKRNPLAVENELD